MSPTKPIPGARLLVAMAILATVFAASASPTHAGCLRASPAETVEGVVTAQRINGDRHQYTVDAPLGARQAVVFGKNVEGGFQGRMPVVGYRYRFVGSTSAASGVLFVGECTPGATVIALEHVPDPSDGSHTTRNIVIGATAAALLIAIALFVRHSRRSRATTTQ